MPLSYAIIMHRLIKKRNKAENNGSLPENRPDKKMKPLTCSLIALLLLLLLFDGCRQATNHASNDEEVWHWTDIKTAEETIVMETIVDEEVVSIAKFPVCKIKRFEIKPELKQQTVKYHFILKKQSGREFNDIEEGEAEGNIWEAGSEENGIIFGISWVIKNRVVLNTLHFTKINEDSCNELAPGVRVKIYRQKK